MVESNNFNSLYVNFILNGIVIKPRALDITVNIMELSTRSRLSLEFSKTHHEIRG